MSQRGGGNPEKTRRKEKLFLTTLLSHSRTCYPASRTYHAEYIIASTIYHLLSVVEISRFDVNLETTARTKAVCYVIQPIVGDAIHRGKVIIL